MNRMTACVTLAVTTAVAAAGAERPAPELRPTDLTPVTWLETPKHAPVEIVRDGKARAVIYVADAKARERLDWRDFAVANRYVGDFGPPPALPQLLCEMDEVIRLQTGAALEWVTNAPPPGQPAIVIGDCEEARKAGIDAAKLPPEGFVVKTAKNRVYLVGTTQPYLEQERGGRPDDGTAWAVADFLERFADVRWYWRTESGGRSVPRRASLVVSPAHYSDQPACRRRVTHILDYSMAALDTEGENPADQMPLPFAPGVYRDPNPQHDPDGAHPCRSALYEYRSCARLLRYGCSVDFSVPYLSDWNGTHRVVARAEKDPLYTEAVFALKDDGKRDKRWNCYSAPETLDAFLDRLAQDWGKEERGYPEPLAGYSLGIWFPGSPGLACHCPACNATAAKFRDDRKLRAELTAKFGERRAFETVEADVHYLVFGLFLQRLCDAVKQRWPEKLVVFTANNGAKAPEGVKFADNLRVIDAYPYAFSLGQALHPSLGGEYEATIRSWGVPVYLRGGQMACDWAYAPIQYPHLVHDFYLRNRNRIGGTRLNPYNPRIWITAAPTCYVWHRVQWNPELDVDAAFDEMCRRLFGPAAETCRELLRLQCDRWEKTPLSRPLTWEDRHGGQLSGARGMGSLLEEWRLPDDLYREIWPPDVVARIKELYEKAAKEIAASGDENARRAFYHWNWTTEAFFEEAAAVHRDPALLTRDMTEAPFAPVENLPATQALDLGAGVELKLALIRPGEFQMGSAANTWGHQRIEAPQHRVRITKPFYMGIYELTVAQYEAIMGKGSYQPPGSTGHGNDRMGWAKLTSVTNRPAERISWHDATNICRRLTETLGRKVRLPTEAEWEYACRAGTTTQWVSGDEDRLEALKEYAWLDAETAGGPQDVGGKKPNAWGLYDMHGNVYEWCSDRYAADTYARGPLDNPAGPTNGMFRVLRGGCAFVLGPNVPELTRSARRNYAHPDIRSRQVGLRIVVEAGGEK